MSVRMDQRESAGGAPVVVLGDDIFASDTRGRRKVDGLELLHEDDLRLHDSAPDLLAAAVEAEVELVTREFARDV
jgi:hypothetical protein